MRNPRAVLIVIYDPVFMKHELSCPGMLMLAVVYCDVGAVLLFVPLPFRVDVSITLRVQRTQQLGTRV